jgi:hypothetical protein
MPDEARGAISLQVAAFRERERAREHVESLRREGLPAFSAPAEIPGRGRWFRVYVGPYPTEAAARSRLAADRKDVAKPHRLPYALESDPLPSYERAVAVVASLRDLGYAPSVIAGSALRGPPHFRVIVDAFATADEAQAAAVRFQATRAGFRTVVR